MKKIALFILTVLISSASIQARQIVLSGVTSGDWDIDITLWADDNGIVAGYVFQPEASFVAGWWETYPDDIADYYGIRLTGYEKGGKVTSTYRLNLRKNASGEFTFEDGECVALDPEFGDHHYTLNQMTCETVTPEVRENCPLQPATLADLSESYEYVLPGDRGGFFEMMVNANGEITFDVLDRSAGDGVASAASDADRPGKLVGNVMEYPRVNDCGDTLRATFYRHFVVVETLQKPGTEHGCYGINAVFIEN